MPHNLRKLRLTFWNSEVSNFFITCSLFVLSVQLSWCQGACSSGPCYPTPSDIADKFNVTANSTCGDPAEQFCMDLDCSKVCNEDDPDLQHNVSFITDKNETTFWKSKNLEYPVVVQLDIGRTFMLYESIVTFHHQLPEAMYISKSNDSGLTYRPISFFATDCMKSFNMNETHENDIEGLKVQCFRIDESSNPEKELFYSPLQDPNTATDLLTDSEKQAFFLMTNLRLVLVKFITPVNFNPDTILDPLKKQYFFSISDWEVEASCFCNGQASKCDADDPSKCICERNTQGYNCERCLPLFNNKPYRIREACEDCGCNNHSDSCTYSEAKGYGVCDNCQHNTVGDKCDKCRPTYYKNPDVTFSHITACQACACNVSGVNSSANSSVCHNETGQCECKSTVIGRACDTCRDEFWNLYASSEEGCEGCECNVTGTVNASNVCNKITGQCPCIALRAGRKCNRCKDGFFGLTGQNRGCSECNCNPAGSLNDTCNSVGQCFCRPRFFGDKCENIEQGFFLPSVDYMTYEAEEAFIPSHQEMKINHTTITNSKGASVLLVGVVLNEGDSDASSTNLSFIINIPKTGFYSFILRYLTMHQWKLIKITALLRSNFTSFSCNGGVEVTQNEPYIMIANISPSKEAQNFGSHCVSVGQYRVDLEIPFGSAEPAVVTRRKRRATAEQEIIVDSVVVMPTVSRYDSFQDASSSIQENLTFYYNQSFSLRTWSASSQAGNVALSRVFGEIFGGGKACNCSTVGSNNPAECEQYGGSCSCKANVIGRTCEKCRPDYFNFTSGQGCQACDCNIIGANQTSCHDTTGQCSCRQNVIGLHCDSCERYHYGFSSGAGCSPCSCDPTYSTDLQCNGSSGACNCKPGINGGKCTGCQDGYYNLTAAGCMPCQCNSAGSINLVCNKTTGQCHCKTQSIGRTCAECPAGHYGLSVRNPDGCLECHCSNKSSTCAVAADWFVSMINTSLYTNENNVGTDGWSAVDGGGRLLNLTELDWNKWIVLAVKASIRVETSSSQEIYFSAPPKYLGDKRFAYTYSMSFYLLQENALSPANSSRGDVILTGRWFDHPLVTTLNSSPPDGDNFRRYEVRFVEKDWRVGNTSGRQPTSYEMIVVLSELTSLLIRAKWTTLNTEKYSWIGDISMTISDKETMATQEEKAVNVENCTCPVEYDGQFCEQCASGYTRMPLSGGPYVACVPCMCNGHSNTCNPDTGVCYNCQHNTAGNHCEMCADGWYGNATNGTSEDCKPCPCPGGPNAPNQFAETCKVDNDGQPTCVNCSQGHEGRNCESCMDGYYGQPMEHDGSCQLCNCSGNIDRSSSGNCNTTSGECLKCLYNTTGFDCEWCAPGFHGNALNQTCTECTCSAVGATSNNCNNVSGICDCQPYVTGPLCDECEQLAFNFTSSGCLPCNCDRDGSAVLQCDLTLGNCSCLSNVIGTKCDMCTAGFFDVTQGCQECDCTVNQTVANTTCDPNSGQCECRVSMAGGKYGGRQCQTCALQTVGSPPSCYPCTEQCFHNWFNTIANESTKINQLDAEVTALLESFGSMPVDHINQTLQELYLNVSYANRIFQNGGREDLEKRRDQIEQIQSSISQLQQELNQSKELIDDAQTYLKEQVVNFNGSVRIIPATAVTFPVVCPSGGGLSVVVDWQCIEAMALSYQQRALQVNESGYANYSSILSSYNMIQQANSVASDAASQISDALVSLQKVSNVTEQIESDLGPSFLNLYQNHSIRLEEIRRITETLQDLLTVSTDVGEQANRKVVEAEQLMTSAQTLATQRKREARTAFENATNAHTDALGAHTESEITLNVASEFKRNATIVLNQTREALENVTAGRTTIAKANNMTLEAINIADEVKGMNVPVSLEEIQNLATEILNTTVNEALVNQTLQEAEKSLEQAKAAESLSERAVNVSRQTLNTVEDIEKTMEMSSQYRQEAVELQQQTDNMITNIKNITETVQQRFLAAYSSGQSLLTEINSTIDNLEGSILCFDNAKSEAESASQVARTAYNVSKEAKEIFDNSSVSLSPAAALINSSYEEANRSLAEVEQAHQDAEQLLKDVTEAEILLEQYILQRTELEKLSQEIQQLDAEADNLLAQYSVAAEQYGQCTGA